MNNTNLFRVMGIWSRVAAPAQAVLIPQPRAAAGAAQGRWRPCARPHDARPGARAKASALLLPAAQEAMAPLPAGGAGNGLDDRAPVSGAGRI